MPASSSRRSPQRADMATRDPERRPVDVPPWLWLWVGLFLLGLPGLLDLARGSVQGYVRWQASLARLRAADPGYGRLEWLLVPSLLLDLLPAAALLLGVAAVALPSLRRLYVERRYRLTRPPSLPMVGEIEAWVAARHPAVTLRANILRSAPLAFVYPHGYGRSALALFGGLVVLWRSDRAAAEAVLRHELAHHDRGDAAILGVGSLFEAVVRFAGLYYLVLYIVPMLVLIAAGALRLRGEVAALGVPADDVWSHQLRQLATLHAPGLAAITLSYLFRVLAALVVPLAGIWVAELAADARVAASFGGEEGVRRALAATRQRRVAWWRWLLMRLSHPPLALRRAALRARGGAASVALLLAFPAAFALRLAALHTHAILNYGLLGYTVAEIAARALDNTRAFLSAQAPAFLAMGALLALWPLVARPWEALWSGASPGGPRPSPLPYALGALALAAVALVGLGP